MLPLELPPITQRATARETTRGYTGERMKIAVANWFNLEARSFSLEPPITPAEITPALLLTLGLECVERADEDDIRLMPTTPERILARLFAVASTGGPHEGYEGAYGRLYAWQTLGAMADASPDQSIDEVMAQVRECHWFYFEAEADWFYQVGWDVGIVALRPDSATLAVLAATATD
jgi:hypothetical protein